MKPKLTLRDLFWLVLVAAIACAWWLDHRRVARQIGELKRSILEASGKARRPSIGLGRWATTDYPHGNKVTRDFLAWSATRHPHFASVVLDPAGDCLELNVHPCCGVTDADVAEIARLSRLTKLTCYGKPLTDDGLLALANLPNLQAVHIVAAENVSDQAIDQFQKRRPDVCVELPYRD